MRTFGAILLGLMLFFPGVELLRWLLVQVLGVYDAMTLTDGCLLIIIILLCIQLLRRPPVPPRVRSEIQEQESFGNETPLRYLPSRSAAAKKSSSSRLSNPPRRPR